MKNTIFYYVRDNETRMPIATICLKHDGEKWSRGIALCSTKDRFSKTLGKRIAEGRADKAKDTKQSYEFFLYKGPFSKDRMDDMFYPMEVNGMISCEKESYEMGFKSRYDAQLTEFEKSIVSKDSERKEVSK